MDTRQVTTIRTLQDLLQCVGAPHDLVPPRIRLFVSTLAIYPNDFSMCSILCGLRPSGPAPPDGLCFNDLIVLWPFS